jgi:hypothetical protein
MELHYNRHNSNKSFYGSPASESNLVIEGARNDRPQSNLDIPLPKLNKEGLPVLATSNDVREVVRFLKDKPAGIPLVEILDSEPRRVFEARKIIAYEYWGIIERDETRIKLTPLGKNLAETVKLENEIFKSVLRSVPVYLAAIEWINEHKLNIVTHYDISEYWNQMAENLGPGQSEDKNSEAEVVSFFSICHAAELGIATVGKRGQPARLRIEPAKLRKFLSAQGNNHSNHSDLSFNDSKQMTVSSQSDYQFLPDGIRNVYISTPQVDEAIENLCDAMELADFQSSISTVTANENDYLQSSKIETMQSCQAGIFIIEDKDCEQDNDGQTKIKSCRLMEIVAALALFNQRIIILWRSEFAPSGYLQNNLQLIVETEHNFRTSFQAVKLLKSMNAKN